MTMKGRGSVTMGTTCLDVTRRMRISLDTTCDDWYEEENRTYDEIEYIVGERKRFRHERAAEDPVDDIEQRRPERK